MKVEFRSRFKKDLEKLQDAALLERIKAAIVEVENAGNLSELSNIKKIKSEGDYYRIRVGDYRIGIRASEETVTFVRILHRKEIYRYFP